MTRSRNTSENKLSLIFGFVLGLLIVSLASPATAQVTQSFLTAEDVVINTQQLSVNEQLDVIHDINTQRSEQAKILIEGLEQQSVEQPLSDVQTLRLRLLRCFNLLEFGHFEQAITLSTQGEQTARELKYDVARPYFMQCGATAYQSLGNTLQEQLLTEESLRLAKRYSEKQAIVNSLFLSSYQSTNLENYNQSIENLRLALEYFEEAGNQFQHWYLVPKSYVLAEITNVFFSMGDLKEALHFAEVAYGDPSTFGKLSFAFTVNLARIYIALNDQKNAINYLQVAESIGQENASERDITTTNSILATIHLHVGDYDIAEKLALSSIELFIKYKEPINMMRIKRTLAQVYIAQQKDNQALTLLNEIIAQAAELKQYSDLEEFNQI
ncbi:tetratricopeptide repeat protein, partial [Shewanella sp.]|uniref:tetratricopeptide repeat protein n=1 Tax=Shewanella sp. TaxID=50422 RepID=UPI003567DC74